MSTKRQEGCSIRAGLRSYFVSFFQRLPTLAAENYFWRFGGSFLDAMALQRAGGGQRAREGSSRDS